MRPPIVASSTLILLGLVAQACAHQPELTPAPNAHRVAGQPLAATATAAGVMVTAFIDTWNGSPPDLRQGLTPIEVKIENHSDRPIRIRYNEFSLVTQTGYALALLPPYDIRSAPLARQHSPGFIHRGFALAPYYPELFYPGVPLWPHPWLLDESFYGENYTRWPQALPTRDLIERALPEGVIQPNGLISGFVYFPALRSGHYMVSFTVQVVEANGTELGKVSIPFEVTR